MLIPYSNPISDTESLQILLTRADITRGIKSCVSLHAVPCSPTSSCAEQCCCASITPVSAPSAGCCPAPVSPREASKRHWPQLSKGGIDCTMKLTPTLYGSPSSLKSAPCPCSCAAQLPTVRLGEGLTEC